MSMSVSSSSKPNLHVNTGRVFAQSPYEELLDDFEDYCHYVRKQQIGKENPKSTLSTQSSLQPTESIDFNWSKGIAELCANLCSWIYTPAAPLPQPTEIDENDETSEWIYKRITPCASTQITQWALLQHSKLPRHLYLIWKGSDAENIFDTIADTGVIPVPIFCHRKKDETFWDFAVHSGMHSALMRDFFDIWKIIHQRIETFDLLIVSGHSLGGGMSILFALETIINGYISRKKKKHLLTITFGSPSVISLEREFEKLSKKSQLILGNLHDTCHCFVNGFDPIPRIPARTEWIMTVIPYAMRRIIREKFAANSLVAALINQGTNKAHKRIFETAGRYIDILASYRSFGTFYFIGKNEPFITKNCKVIEQILAYLPPHKVMDDGRTIRVCHFYTAQKIGIAPNRFSLRYLRDLTRLHQTDDEEKEWQLQCEDTESVRSDDMNDLLSSRNVFDGDWNEEDCIYNLMKTNQESIERIIQNKKLSGKDWLKCTNNHATAEYIRLFEQINIDSLSVGEIEQFKEMMAQQNMQFHQGYDDDKSSLLNSIKSKGSKMWNNVKKMTSPRNSGK